MPENGTNDRPVVTLSARSSVAVTEEEADVVKEEDVKEALEWDVRLEII